MWLYVIVIIVIIIIIFRHLSAGSDPTKSFILRPVVYLSLKTGIRFDIEADFQNPEDIIKYDANRAKNFVRRTKAMLDGADTKVYLSKLYRVFIWHGWVLILDDLDIIADWIAKVIHRKEQENMTLRNENASLRAENIDLKHKMKEEFGELVDYAKDMTDAVFRDKTPKKK